MINPQWLELPMSCINFHIPKDVRAIEILLYIDVYCCSKTSSTCWSTISGIYHLYWGIYKSNITLMYIHILHTRWRDAPDKGDNLCPDCFPTHQTSERRVISEEKNLLQEGDTFQKLGKTVLTELPPLELYPFILMLVMLNKLRCHAHF